MSPDDVVTDDSGQAWRVGEQIAYMGDVDCNDPRCRRIGSVCCGYHCAKCGEPCSMMGHSDCEPAA